MVSLKWKNVSKCCILFSKLEKNVQNLLKVNCQKDMFWELKTKKMKFYLPKIFKIFERTPSNQNSAFSLYMHTLYTTVQCTYKEFGIFTLGCDLISMQTVYCSAKKSGNHALTNRNKIQYDTNLI